MFPTSTTSVFEVTLNSIKQLNFCRKFCLVSLLDSHFISVSKCNNHLILKVSNEYQPMIGYSNFCLNSEKDHPHRRVALFPPCVLASSLCSSSSAYDRVYHLRNHILVGWKVCSSSRWSSVAAVVASLSDELLEFEVL